MQVSYQAKITLGMFNKVLKNIPVGIIVKGGKEIQLAVVTRTEAWYRIDEHALMQVPVFEKTIAEKMGLIKDGTTDIGLR